MNVKKLLLFMLVTLTGAFHVVHATQLSGTYTIDAAATATATTFKNVSSAITYLQGSGTRTDGGPSNTAPFGVSGPVVFMVAAGTYTEQVTFKGMVNGASPVNTITFEGTSAASRIITYAATTSATPYTIKLDSVKYVNLRNLTIIANGASNGWGVLIMNSNTSANKITNCTISIAGAGTTATTVNYCGIVIGGSATSATTGIGLDSLELDSNTINAGFYGIICSGLSTRLQMANKIRNNKIYNSYSYAIYTNYQDGITITGNTLILRPTIATNNGILLQNSNSNTTLTGITVNRNRISNFGVYGIRVSSSSNSNAGTKGEICNNMIGGGITGATSSPLSMASSNNWNVSNNTINHDIAATAVANSAVSITAGLNINFLNNIVAETKGGLGLPLYTTTSNAIDTMNYNILYRSDTNNNQLVSIGGLVLNTGSFKRGAATDSNSMFLKPVFVNDTNLRLYQGCNKGKVLSYVTLDIDGRLRSAPPVIGAHETQPVANNIAIDAIVSPANPIDTGLQDMVVRVKNVGSNTVTFFSVTYSLNGGALVNQTWSGSLATCDTVSVIFTGAKSIRLGPANYIKVYSSLPNGVTDANTVDDTLNSKYYHILNGTYTIGTGGQFTTISDAKDALQSRGVSGPVTFMVNAGTYTGQLIINGPISGASSTNTIVFNGTNASTRIITASIASAATVVVNQCNYIHFRNLTIKNTYTGSCTGFAWVGSATNSNGRSNSIKFCTITMPNLSTASAIGIAATGSVNGFTMTDNRMDSLVIDSNTFTGCNTAISLRGVAASATNLYNRDYKIRGNTITTTTAQSDVAIFVTNVSNGVETKYNKITSSAGVGIYYSSCRNNFTGNAAHEISFNQTNTGYGGIQSDGALTLSTNTTKIYNNNVFVRSSGIATGIYLSGSGIDEIYHNTIHIDSASALVLGMCFNYDGSTSTKVKNNVFAYSGAAGGTIYPVYIQSGITGDNLNYNVYYNAANGDLVNRNGVTYGKTNLLTDSTGGDSSFNLKPAFVSDENLHLSTGCPRGTNLVTSVPTDFDGVLRSTAPSIGCYEFGGYSNDLQLQQITKPTIPLAAGLQDLQVLLANNGSNTITSFTVSYKLNSASVVSIPWTGTLAPCDTISILFTGANKLNIANGISTLKVYTSLPNGGVDGNRLNDTITRQVGPALSGTYVVGTAPSDFTTMVSAADALTIRGVSGKVVFNIKTATYPEAIALSQIAGSSDQNTITFQSVAAHRDSVKMINSSAAVTVVSLSGTSYITFRNMTLTQTTSADYNSALFMTGDASFDTIENCSLTVPAFVADANMALYSNALTGNGVIIRNNVVTGGYGGIVINLFDAYFNPNTFTKNHRIENNRVLNANNNSIFVYQITDLVLKGNTILPDAANTGHYAIQIEHCDSSVLVSGNNIKGLSGGYGIALNACTGTKTNGVRISNNEISFGTNTSAYGIYTISSTGIRYYNNSVNITSTASVNNIAAYFSGGANGDYTVTNNIFSNSGGGLAVSVDAAYKFDYNNLYTTGTVLAKYVGTNYANLALWRASTGTPDLRSVSFRPAFTSSTNLQPNPADTGSWALNGRGLQLPGNAVDLLNQPRPVTPTDGVPDIGAYEFTPTVLPPVAVPNITSPVPGDTQVYVSVFAPKDTVAIIYWDISNLTFPSKVVVRQYSGTKPKQIGSGQNYMYFYTDMDGTSTGFYNYSIDVYYKQNWMGTTPQEADVRIVKKVQNLPWIVDNGPNSVIDTARNVMRTKFQNDSSAIYTGTDTYNPLPVKLEYVTVSKSGDDAIVSWNTTAEENSSVFEIERSYDGKQFEMTGKVKAAGKPSGRTSYQYTDVNPSADKRFNEWVYYRLKMIDHDGRFEYSKTVQVDWRNTQENVNLYPNPFSNETFLALDLKNASEINIEWMDLAGKVFDQHQYQAGVGAAVLNIVPEKPLASGIYFVSVNMNGSRKVYKLIKE
jgi:hypothetical protein